MILILSFLQIFLHTMRKYVLGVVVKSGVSPSQELCLPLQDTTFIAVSTYHNRDVAQLKIQHNHYARNAHPTNKSPLPYSVASGSDVALATPHPAAPMVDHLATNSWPPMPNCSPLPNWSYPPYLQPQDASPCKTLTLYNYGIDLFLFPLLCFRCCSSKSTQPQLLWWRWC